MMELNTENPRTCVVIGGLGFVGRSLVLRLLKLGNWTVRIADLAPPPSPTSPSLDQSNSITEAVSDGRASYVQVDVRDKSQVLRAVSGTSVVFYMESTDSIMHDLYQCYMYTVQGVKNVINACQECKVRRLIYNSTADVVFDGVSGIHYGDESMPYPWKYQDMLNDLKAQAEALVLVANSCDGLLTCALRPSNVFGPADTFLVPFLVYQAKSFWAKFILGNGDNLSDFTFVENVAHAHICAAEALVSYTAAVAGKAFFITNLEPMNYWEFVARIYKGLGYRSPMIKLPAKMVYAMLPLVKWLRDQLGSEINHQLRSAHFALQSALFTKTFDCSAAQEYIGYLPIISLEDGIALTTQSFSHLSKDSLPARLGEETKVEKFLGGGTVADILLWRDEKETFTWFLGLVVLYYWYFLCGRTFISSTAKLLLIATVFFSVRNIFPFSIFDFSYRGISSSCLQISESGIKDIVATTVRYWNKGISISRSLAEGEDWNIFLKATVSLYFLKMFLSLSVTTVVFLVLVFIFTSFFTYEQYEEEIDGFARIASTIARNLVTLLLRNLPTSVSSLFFTDGPQHQHEAPASVIDHVKPA